MIARAALFLATFALIAGCGSEDESPNAALASAAEKTADVKTLRQEFTMESDLGGDRFTFDGTGINTVDNKTGRMDGTMDVGDGPFEFESISVDDAMYLKSDEFGLPEGKWLKTEDVPATTMSPGEFVGFLKDSEGVEQVGTETIRGEQTTHYRGPLDIKAMAEQSGSEIVEELRKTPNIDKLDIVVDIWVRPDGLPARLALDMSAPGEAEGTMKMTSDILEYDVPVDVEAPPASDVTDSLGG